MPGRRRDTTAVRQRQRRARPAKDSPSRKAHPTATPAVPRQHTGPPTVLLVDDDADSRTMYGFYLRSLGCIVHTAADGDSAVKSATSLQPDVIVLDLAMPIVDGWTAAERLKRASVTRHIPIVALTAVPGARESTRISGCDAFLAKPCLPQLLWCEISLLLNLHQNPSA